jgi:hypothetical protein
MYEEFMLQGIPEVSTSLAAAIVFPLSSTMSPAAIELSLAQRGLWPPLML